MMRSSPQHYGCYTDWGGRRRRQAHPDAAKGCPVQKMFQCTETGAVAAGVAGSGSTNVATGRVLEMVVEFGIGEANLGDVVGLALLPIEGGAAYAGAVVAVPAGHLTDSATSNKSQQLYGTMSDSCSDDWCFKARIAQ